MRECGKYVKMRDFPHDFGTVDTYASDKIKGKVQDLVTLIDNKGLELWLKWTPKA